MKWHRRSQTVTPIASNSNYLFGAVSSILHVNPYGPGTKKIRPVLNCIQEIDDGSGYIANFEYENKNDADVYIEAGTVDNWLEGGGIDPEILYQPSMFFAGGGTFMVYFDGTELSWSVTSIESNHKVSSAANANSSSTKCPPDTKSASVSVKGEKEIAGPDQLQVYPNPVNGWLHITLKGLEDYEMITLLDLSGRSYRVTSVQVRSDLVELDMNSMSPGSYVVRILMKDRVIMVPVIKN